MSDLNPPTRSGCLTNVEMTRLQQALVELAPDTQWRLDHMQLAERGILSSVVIFGQRDGGPFEIAFLRVDEIDSTVAK